MKFDTRDKKPKLYHLAGLTVLAVAGLLALIRWGGDARLRWANVILSIYFALAIACLWRAFRGQLEYNPYSYNTIIYTGFSLFALFLLGVHLYAAVRGFRGPEGFSQRQMLLTLVNSAKSYMLLTAPFLLLFSAALFISNVELIRHEGRRFVNVLGMILALLLVAGEAGIALLDRWLSQGGQGRAWPQLLVNLGAAFYLYFESMTLGAIVADVIAARFEPEKDKDFLIVLGCGLRRDGTPTPLLRGRLDLALDFYRRQLRETGRDARFVCSGGQGPDEVCPEAVSMREYLLSRGIPEEKILVEDRSTDTAENMRFSKEKIAAVGGEGKIAFFTTNYHVFRAGLKARRVKMRAQGMGAPTRWYFWPNASVREFVGLLTEHRGKQGLLLGGIAAAYTVLTFLSAR